jgi:hypothetical protein
MPARLLVRVKTDSSVQDKVPFTPSLTTPQDHSTVTVIVPPFPITNLSTISGNRPLLSEINLHPPRLPGRIKHPSHDPRNLSHGLKNLSHDPKNLSHNPKNLSYDLKNLSHDPKNLSHNPKNLSYGLKNLSYDLKNLSHDPKNLSHNPKNLSYDLKNLSHDPKQQGSMPSRNPLTPAPTHML